MIVVHCDGSIYPNPNGACGWGFTALDSETGEIFHEEFGGRGPAPGNTNNRAEMAALMYALRWLDRRPAMIWSDSQYVVNGSTTYYKAWQRSNWTRKPKSGPIEPVPNADLWIKILAVLEHLDHRIQWVRGHAGTAGNERADALALMGRKSVEGADSTTFTHVRLPQGIAA